MKANKLEKYYPGDEHWINFVDLYQDTWDEFDIKSKLVSKLNGDLDLAKVIFGILGTNSLNWIDKKIPALDNLMPKECIYDDNLKNRLRTLLLRMPK